MFGLFWKTQKYDEESSESDEENYSTKIYDVESGSYIKKNTKTNVYVYKNVSEDKDKDNSNLKSNEKIIINNKKEDGLEKKTESGSNLDLITSPIKSSIKIITSGLNLSSISGSKNNTPNASNAIEKKLSTVEVQKFFDNESNSNKESNSEKELCLDKNEDSDNQSKGIEYIQQRQSSKSTSGSTGFDLGLDFDEQFEEEYLSDSEYNKKIIIEHKETKEPNPVSNEFDYEKMINNELENIKKSKREDDMNLELYNRVMKKINKLKEKMNETESDEESDLESESDSDSDSQIETDGEKELESDSESKIGSDEESDMDPEEFSTYIVKESKRTYNHNSYYCQFLWSGIEYLDHWELQRKINKDHSKIILSQMKSDYEKSNNFTFYDVIHLGLKPDGKYYVIDGQHRLVAYYNLFLKNKYPIQKVPAVIWETKSDDEFLEIYEKINKRVPFDITPFNRKILDIIFQLDEIFGKKTTIWGKKRPKIDKTLFIDEMNINDSVHKLDADSIVKKIVEINIKIRGLPRSKRSVERVSSGVHTQCEEMDFYLGYDKNLKWIHDIKI